MIKEIKEIVEYIKSVIEGTSTASVKAIIQSVFKVNIENEELGVRIKNEEPIPVSGDVNIKNFPDNSEDLEQLKDLIKQLQPLLKRLDKDQKTSITNFRDIKFPDEVKITNPQKSVEITNLDALYKVMVSVKTAIDRLPQEYPKIKIPEPQKIPPFPKFPEINFPKIPEFPKEISVKDMQKLIKLAEKLTAGDAKEPISVRLSDGKKFYEAITEVLTSGGGSQVPFTYQTGGRESALITGKREQVVSMVERFTNNDVDSPNATTNYIGQEDVDGNWLIQKITETGTINSFRYATIKNNSSKKTYASAWSARASLSYGKVSEALT